MSDKLKEQLETPSTSGGNETTQVIDTVLYNKILSKIGKNLYKDNIPSEQYIADLIKEHNGDVNKVVDVAINDIAIARIKEAKNPTTIKNNPELQNILRVVMNAVVSNLPSAKILVQEILTEYGTSKYDVINKVFKRFDFIEAGAGKDYIQSYLPIVDILDTSSNDYFPSRNNLNNNTATATVTLPDTIWRSYITITEPDYVQYFLSGKITEWVKVKIKGTAESIKQKQFVDCCTLLNTIYKTLKAKATSTSETPTSHIVSQKNGFIDAWGEVKELHQLMFQQNNRFILAPNENIKYTWLRDSVMLVPLKVFNTVNKYDITMLTKAIGNFIGDIIYIPEQVFNPLTQAMESCNIFTNADDSINDSCVMVLDGNDLVRLFNLYIENTTDLPIALTSFAAAFSRYTVDVLPWCSSMLYENANGLTADFVVPTKEQE